jgi:hypothetical protein
LDRHFGADSVAGTDGVDDSFREKKRRRLMEAKKNHMENIQFLRGLDDADSKETLAKALKDFCAVCDQITEYDKEDGILDSQT